MPVEWQVPTPELNLRPQLREWLLNTGSLTERLQALTSHFSLELLGQREMPMAASEKRLLLNNEQQLWQIREVLLQGDHKDWVFARSIIPSALCNSKWANLGTQPLGQRIFNDPSFVRSGFEIGTLKYHPLSGKAFDTNETCWARRSKFMIEQSELIVAEAVLPNAPCYE